MGATTVCLMMCVLRHPKSKQAAINFDRDRDAPRIPLGHVYHDAFLKVPQHHVELSQVFTGIGMVQGPPLGAQAICVCDVFLREAQTSS